MKALQTTLQMQEASPVILLMIVLDLREMETLRM
jgi:hypothetical protein